MVVFIMRDSVPSGSYSSVCNVLRQWNIPLIPTYRVHALYDIYLYICAPNRKKIMHPGQIFMDTKLFYFIVLLSICDNYDLSDWILFFRDLIVCLSRDLAVCIDIRYLSWILMKHKKGVSCCLG